MKHINCQHPTILFFVSLLCCSCVSDQKELVYSIDESSLKVEVWEYDLGLLETQNASTSDINITAKGSLAFVLTSAHNSEDADLDISTLENENQGVELTLETPLAPSAKEKINEVLAKFAEATDHRVFYGMEPAEVLILRVSNPDLLKKHAYEATNGVESSVSRINESIKSRGNLSKLIQVLNKKVLPLPIETEIADELDELLFSIEMNWSDGFDQAYEELERTYGLSIKKKSLA